MRGKKTPIKLHMLLLAALVFCVAFLAPRERALASSKVEMQGFDDFLRMSDGGVNWFGHELISREQDILHAQQAKARLEELLSHARVALGIPSGLYGAHTATVCYYRIEGERETVTLYSSAFPGGFLNVKVGQLILESTYYSYRQRVNDLDDYIARMSEDLTSIRTIYNGFTVVGSRTATGSAQANKTFVAGELTTDQNGLLARFRQNMNQKLYNVGDNTYESAVEEDYEAGTIEKYIAEPIGEGAFRLYLWMSNWNIDLTVDGLIFGRLSPTYHGNVDFTHFGMEENNPYGIVAATAYYVLRRILLGVLPVIMMCMLLRQLFHNGQKGRAMLKEAFANFLFAIVLSFVAPYLIEIFVSVRDGVLKYTSLGMGSILNAAGLGSGVGSNVIGLVYITYQRNHTLLNALVWAAAVGSGFFYFVTYVQIAMLLMGCVAIAPVCLFISIWNQKIIKDWWNVFFPNLCVPIIDLILLQLPSVMLLLFRKRVGAGGGSIVLGIIVIVIMWNSILIRDRVVRLLGFEGLGRNGGGLLGGLMAAGMMAMRMARNTGRAVAGTVRGMDGQRDGGEGGMMERGINAQREGSLREAVSSIGSEVPAALEGPSEQEARLGNSTEQFLNTLDDQYGKDGSMPQQDNDLADAGTPGGAEVTADGLTDGDGGVDGVSPLDYEGEVPEGEENSAEGYEGEGELPGELNVEYPEGGIPGDPEGAGENALVGGPEEMPLEGEGIAAITTDPAALEAAGEGAAVGTAVGTAVGAASSAGTSPDITEDPKGYMQSERLPNKVPLSEDVEGEFRKAFRPEKDAEGRELERGAYGSLYNKEFHDSLGTDAEKNRYTNLARMEAYNAKIESNEKEMHRIGYSRDSYEKERAGFIRQEDRLTAHMEAAKTRINGMTDRTGEEYQKEMSAYNEMKSQKALIHDRVAKLDRAAGLDHANQIYRQQVTQMEEREKSYGKAWSVGGMNGRTYQSAKDFEYQTRLDGVTKSLATYRDFDSKRFEGILSPAEREAFYREREVHERRERAIRTASNIGSVAASVSTVAGGLAAGMVLGVGSAYGGQRASVSGAATGAVGAMAAGSAARWTGGHVARATYNIADRLPVRQAAPSGQENARSGVGSAGSQGSGTNPSGASRSATPSGSRNESPKPLPRELRDRASARTLSQNARAGEREDRTPKEKPVNGTGNAGSSVLSGNANGGERQKRSGGQGPGNERGQKGAGNASSSVLSGNARNGERPERRRTDGGGNASSRQIGQNARQGQDSGSGQDSGTV